LNTDIELLKVQILADYYHTQLNLWISYYLTGSIGLGIALITFVFEFHLALLIYYVLLVAIAIPIICRIRGLNKEYSERVNFIDDLLRRVENGESLESLSELEKKKKPKEKKVNTMGDKEKETRESFQQAFLLLCGLFIGLIAGTVGGTWGTLYFEYVIKGDTSPSITNNFRIWSIVLVVIGVALIIAMMVFYKMAKAKE
jgi:hypothetical protein